MKPVRGWAVVRASDGGVMATAFMEANYADSLCIYRTRREAASAFDKYEMRSLVRIVRVEIRSVEEKK